MGLPVFLRDGVAQRPGLPQTPWVGLRPPNLIFKHFTKSIVFYTPDLVTFGHLFRDLFQLTVHELNLLKTSLFGKN